MGKQRSINARARTAARDDRPRCRPAESQAGDWQVGCTPRDKVARAPPLDEDAIRQFQPQATARFTSVPAAILAAALSAQAAVQLATVAAVPVVQPFDPKRFHFGKADAAEIMCW